MKIEATITSVSLQGDRVRVRAEGAPVAEAEWRRDEASEYIFSVPTRYAKNLPVGRTLRIEIVLVPE